MLLSFAHKGYLKETGWLTAFEHRQPVDHEGQPIPWVTYSFIDFIKDRISPEFSIFEYGSGNSTLFYSKYAKEVDAVEHDRGWFDNIRQSSAKNATLHFCALEYNGDYCRKALSLEKKYHIIIVDGRDRVNCCKQATGALAEGGVVVLDDSERGAYQEGIRFLKAEGFKELSFSGISPGLFYLKSTSVFYKPVNCLGI